MAVQDFTTYSETDTESRIAVISNKVTFTTMERDDTCYVVSDKGAGAFTGDFAHTLQIKVTSRQTDAGAVLWALSNAAGTNAGLGDCLKLFIGGAGTDTLFLRQVDGATDPSDSWTSFTLNTDYWLTIERISTAFTCKIYTDSGRTTLVKTLSVTLSSAVALRYVTAGASLGTAATDTPNTSGFTQDLDLGAISSPSASVSPSSSISPSNSPSLSPSSSNSPSLSPSSSVSPSVSPSASTSPSVSPSSSNSPSQSPSSSTSPSISPSSSNSPSNSPSYSPSASVSPSAEPWENIGKNTVSVVNISKNSSTWTNQEIS